MRIAQITDIHISVAGDKPHNVDVRAHFLAALQAIVHLGAEHIVLSGDICFRDPSDAIYQWVALQLKETGLPVTIMAGNHDAQSVMHRNLDCAYHDDTDEVYTFHQWAAWPVFFLDTARGVMSDKQYAWFEQGLRSTESDELLVFMHHPPAYCGVPHMDISYAFREIPGIQALLKSSGKHFRIYCGHYHVERILQFANQTIHITPSTFFQIDATEEEFRIDHKKPGFRIIDIDGKAITTECVYLPGESE